MDETIFKAYDVRGIYPDQMDEEIAYRSGAGSRWCSHSSRGCPSAICASHSDAT